MRRGTLVLACCGLALCCGAVAPAVPGQEKKPAVNAEEVELRALLALRAGKPQALEALAEVIRGLDEATRRDLTVRVRPGAVEFRFRGDFPGNEFRPEMLEYVIAPAGERDYETLLAVGPPEAARLKRLAEALPPGAKTPPLQVVLTWSEGERPRAEDLRDIIRLETPQNRRDFLARLEFMSSGLGAFNVKADTATLPSKRMPAEVLIAVPMPGGK